MNEKKHDILRSVARMARKTVAKSQKRLAQLENKQRERGTPFTRSEIEEYENIIETGRKQVKLINYFLKKR